MWMCQVAALVTYPAHAAQINLILRIALRRWLDPLHLEARTVGLKDLTGS